jgi:Flp pilus assembly protein TadG
MRVPYPFGRSAKDNRGQTIVETTLAILFTVPVILWGFEMGMYCYTLGQYQYAARAGLQYAVSHGTDATDCSGPGGKVNSCTDTSGDNISSLVAQVSQSSGHALASSQIKTTWDDANNNPGSSVSVNIDAPYTPYVKMPFIPSHAVGTATGLVVY